ncbi:tRNA methyltransferase [Candidatus Saccharibacteria bacterium]|nr:tRNA methyltransferase [Candidatus Saccharibacteria bacterium]NIV04592.1 tRNA methyltransferase [Calditrichia bacterium]NIV73206.1 tRNA methyltransferase [Calditrichia bacterium]NIW00571.1 tRNA methyltransferase [Candidatus Saccharibacteria bacterium]NIW80929.1 tRNA methyltransferase [Calditrichia bacterium]
MPTARRIERMSQVIKHRQPDLTVVCENIHDPHNVSAILRSCDAVGIEIVHLFYTNQEFPKLGKKSSASAKKWIDIERHQEENKLRESLKNQGMSIYATGLNEKAVSIYEVDWTKPSAVIMGNEHLGVSDEVLQIADASVYIPMFGMIESLNVSVATAVILYEACRQRMLKGLYPNPHLTEKELSLMLERWKKK